MSWTQVEEAFAAAAALPATERGDFLRELGEHRSEVAREVESLLEADGAAAGFLERPLLPTAVRDGLARLDPRVAPAPVPESIGPYRVLSRIGCGGMSEVFLAERRGSEFSAKVAIKRIRSEILSDELVRRFETERRILARFAHPNIARLLDGGRDAAGLPYLVMEHVDGVPIDEYCDRERLTLDERLALLVPLCSAVGYAHRRLVVHRDIKPGNILVTADGVPKLLDFGIAKILRPERFPGPVAQTATRLRPMTPYYASPEQIANQPITTATDIYSLGALLYRLVTGRFPYRFEDDHPRAVEGTILAQPMVPPVAAIEEGAPPIEALALARSMSARALRRAVRGDLALVLAMALNKEPDRRYESVALLARDLVNLERRLPVHAHRDSLAYRVRRSLARNRAASWLALVLLMLGIAFASALSVQNRRLAEERDRAGVEPTPAADPAAIPAGR